jgi:hypothetical protein
MSWAEIAPACNPCTWEAEVGGSYVWGQPGLHNKTLSQKTKTKPKNRKQNKKKDGTVLTLSS